MGTVLHFRTIRPSDHGAEGSNRFKQVRGNKWVGK
jgi:hypothetical protein